MRRVGPVTGLTAGGVIYAADGTAYADVNPGAGTPGSTPGAKLATVLLEELTHLVEYFGLIPSADDSDLQQVRKAVQAAIAAAVPDLSTYARLNVAQTWSSTQSGTEVTLIDASVISWDLEVAQEAVVTLGGDRILGAPSHIVNGTYYSLLVNQPASGGPYTLAFNPAYTNVVGVTYSTAAEAIDHLVFRATGGKLRLVAIAKNVGA